MTGTYIRSTFITDQSEFIENLKNGKQIGELLDMPKCPQAPKPIFVSQMGGGIKYNSLNSTFKIVLEKGLDSEDANHRDSMNRFRLRSFCQPSEKLYKKQIFFLAEWQDPKRCNFQA